MRVGIYGGTFNPIHRGHLAVAQAALDRLALDQLVFVPAGIPPLKGSDQLVSGAHRLRMVELAIAGHPFYSISDFELSRPQKSFTLDTVHHLLGQFQSGSEFFFILGDDCVTNLHRWKGIDELRTLVRFARVKRLGCVLPAHTTELLSIDMPALDISSTAIRNGLSSGTPVEHLMAPVVGEYIRAHHLYRSLVTCNMENNKNE